MKKLDRESDGDLPKQSSTLSDWRFFAFRNLGQDSGAFAYLDQLCRDFGVDYVIELSPESFLMHIALVQSSKGENIENR